MADTSSRDGPTAKPLTLPQVIAYGLGDIYGGGAFTLIGLLFMFFLTERVGLSPVLAGLVFSIGKVFDAVTDPLMGVLSDRTSSRFGRRRVYFLAGVVPVFASFLVMWLPLEGGTQLGLFLYYSGAYVLFSAVFTMVMVPYSALNAEMTHDYKERTRLTGARIICAQLSTLLAGVLPGMMVDMSAGGSDAGFPAMAAVFATIYALPWILVYLGTRELPGQGASASGLRDYLKQFRRMVRNKTFRTHMGMYVASFTAVDVLMAVFLYFITYYMERPELYTLAIGSLLVVEVAMLPVYVAVSNRYGKAVAYRIGLAIWAFGVVLIWTLLRPASPSWLVVVAAGTVGMGVGAGVLIPWAILPSSADVGELMSGEQRTGMYAGTMTLVRKFVQGVLAMPLVGLVLQVIGFVSNQPQMPATREGIRLLLIVSQLVCIVLGVAASVFFPITPKRHELIRGEIARLREEGSKNDVDPAVREACERATGQPYESLYRQS
jgi:oligogalacturonide transporter